MTLINRKNKYKAWFFIKEGNTFRFRKKKKFNPMNPIVKYHKNIYSADLDNPSFTIGITSYFLFEKDGKQIITIKDSEGKEKKAIRQIKTELGNNDKDTSIKDLLYAKEVIKQVFESLGKQKLILNWIHLIFAVGFSILAGWIIGSYIPIGISG